MPFDEDQYTAEQQVREALMKMPAVKKVVRQVKSQIKQQRKQVAQKVTRSIKRKK